MSKLCAQGQMGSNKDSRPQGPQYEILAHHAASNRQLVPSLSSIQPILTIFLSMTWIA